MLKLPSNKVNSNKNNIEVPLNSRENGPHRDNYQQHLLVRMGRNRYHTAPLGGLPAGAATMEACMENTQTTGNSLTI